MSYGRLLLTATRTLTAVTLSTLLGCTAIGIPVTSDPGEKLHYAYQLMNRGRFIPAQGLIQESLDIYRQQGNDLGEAEAYHAFGNLYKHRGYIDGYVQPHTRFGTVSEAYGKSIDNFTRGKILFEKHDDYAGATRCLVGIGNGYSLLGEKAKACESYAAALRSFDLARQRNPSVRLPILTGFPDAPTLINAFMDEEGCPGR
jgi:tetratricopeptide (TPR) repeat protein